MSGFVDTLRRNKRKLSHRRHFWVEYFFTGERELCELRKYVRQDRIALDIGGNIGSYAYHLSRLAKSVVTFEPNPTYVARLKELYLPRTSIEQVALSSYAGVAELRIPRLPNGKESGGMGTIEGGVVSIEETSRVLEVPVRRLDDYAFKNVGFVKIDVEGHEERVLDGARQTIRENEPVLLIEIENRHNPGGINRIVSSLAQDGYKAFFFHDGKRKDFAEFDPDVHQVVNDDLTSTGTSRRDIEYINNFLFLR